MPSMRPNRSAAPRTRARRFLAVTMAASLVSVGWLNIAQADNCALDPSFGEKGKVSTDFGLGQELAYTGVIQPDGKIVAAGSVLISGTGLNVDFALARYNPDGHLDDTFGGDGLVTTDFGGNEWGYAVALQADGKIVVAGSTGVGTSEDDFAVARYNSDGSLDDGTASDSTPADSFGNLGRVTTDFNGLEDVPHDLAIQQDGKIIVVGRARSASSQDFAMARYDSDGDLDAGFGGGGKVTLDVAGSVDLISSIAIQPTDGKIVVGGGASFTDPPRPDFALARYQTDGTLDSTFGNAGIVTTDFSGRGDFLAEIAVQTDGKIVAAGTTQLGDPSKIALARYQSDGGLDEAFGSGGRVVTDFPEGRFGNFVTSLALHPTNGKIIVGGFIVVFPTNPWQPNDAFLVARYNTNGQLDTSFDSDGRTTTDFFLAWDDILDVLVQPDGNIVALGYYTKGERTHFALARYFGDAADYAPTLDSLTLNTNSVPGSVYLEGKVTLCAPAPAGGIKVTITDNIEAVTLPRTVTVPAGEKSATFTITTKSVLKAQAGNITASLGTVSKYAQLLIKPIAIFAIGVEPNPVEGPNQARGAVVLNGRAPQGGITVTLSSNNPAVASPNVSSIFFPAGAQQRNFTIRTRDVPSARSAIIKATANGSSKATVLTVN